MRHPDVPTVGSPGSTAAWGATPAAGRPAVFLDRDGTINRAAPPGAYITSPGELALLPGAGAAIRWLNRAGILALVVTNQRCVARGLLTQEGLDRVHERLAACLMIEGARVDAIYACTHERGQCRCRKPDTGLMSRAISDFPEIDLARSAMVGDSPDDMEAGDKLGLTTVMLGDWAAPSVVSARERARVAHVTPTLFAAVEWLLTASPVGGVVVAHPHKAAAVTGAGLRAGNAPREVATKAADGAPSPSSPSSSS